jgi:hypothetical protein
MPPVNQIDSVYFIKDHEILNNGGETHDGIRIFVDTRGSADNKYFRWIYDECWKFNVPNPKKYNYINEHEIVEVDHINKTCWHTHTSDETIIQSAGSDRSDLIQKEPVLFVASDMSDRLLVQYSVNIKQLSLSEAEFEFWDHMKQINESGGDIFEKQPFAIISNIHNLTDPDDQVLGYFQVSSVEQKRIFVTESDVRRLNIPAFQYDCTRIEIGPDDYPRPEPPGKPATFDKIYGWFTDSGVIFVEPLYDKQQNLFKLVFTQPLCMDCTLSGTLTKPDFWIDLE